MAFLLAILLIQCPDGSPPPCGRAVRTAPATLSVAVLNFENRSRDSGDAYLADGLGDEIAARLGQVGRLTVTSRVAVRRLRNADAMAVAELGRALRASYLVSGSIQRSGDQVRVAVELLRSATSTQAWSNVYDRRRDDLLGVQAEIATQVAGAVAGRLLPRERAALASRTTDHPLAYDAFLRGTAALALARGGNASGAVPDLERAVALDSTFAQAWAALSESYSLQYWWYADRTDARITAARVAAERALQLAPWLPAARVALGNVYYRGGRDYPRALVEFREALRLAPSNTEAMTAIANIERRQGHWEASLQRRLRILELDPRNGQESYDVAACLYYLRRYDEAERYADRAIALAPADAVGLALKILIIVAPDGDLARARPLVPQFLAHVSPGALPDAAFLPGTILAFHDTLYQRALDGARQPDRRGVIHELKHLRARVTGRPAEAAAHAESLLAVRQALFAADSGDPFIRAGLAWAMAVAGRYDEALRENAIAMRQMPVTRDAFWGYGLVVDNAMILAMAGRADEALDRIEALLRAPSGFSRGLLRLEPAFDNLRGSPRYLRLVGDSPPR